MGETATSAKAMSREEVMRILHRDAARLRSKGIAHLALFGALACGEAGPDSDVDLLADFHPHFDILDHVRLQRELSALLRCKVDLISRRGLKPRMAQRIAGDELRIF